MHIALVGDLSNGDPARLDKVLTAAFAGTTLPQGTAPDAAVPPADLVIQLGDLSGAYDVIRKHLQTGKLHVVPGNHDLEFDSLGIPRNWQIDAPPATLVGLDNSGDSISTEGWSALNALSSQPWTFVFMHKPPVKIVLPDLSESSHMMGEGQPCPDADRLVMLLRQRADAVACGHYHGWTQQQTAFGQMIVDGRGGAAADLGYTLLGITPEGWVLHSIPVAP